MTNPVLEDDVVERLREMAKHDLAESQSTHVAHAPGSVYSAMRRNSAVFYSKTADLIERLQKELGEAREALGLARRALQPFADRVYNDNGDHTISDTHKLQADDFSSAYHANKQVRGLLDGAAASEEIAKAIRSMDGGGK